MAATFPAAVGAGNVEVSQRIADVCLGALAQVSPDRVGAASQGTMNNLLIGGTHGWVYYETVAGGQGGPPRTASRRPVRHPNGDDEHPEHARSRRWSGPTRCGCCATGCGGGAAVWGGRPAVRASSATSQVLEDATVSLITERRVSQPWGLAGGGRGAVGENWLLPGGDESRAERLPDKCTVNVKAGDVVRMLTPGGGGWGSDRNRATADRVARRRAE